MRKILLIGPGGAGKSTLAQAVAQRTGLPLIHLDALFWKPGWIETPGDEWRHTVMELLQRERWVMDGNYAGTLDDRLAACDTVIFLDFPLRTCLWRVLKRRVLYHGRTRPDMAADCPEHVDWVFLKWILNYRRASRPEVLQKLAAMREENKRVIILDSPRSVESFLSQLAVAPSAALDAGGQSTYNSLTTS